MKGDSFPYAFLSDDNESNNNNNNNNNNTGPFSF